MVAHEKEDDKEPRWILPHPFPADSIRKFSASTGRLRSVPNGAIVAQIRFGLCSRRMYRKSHWSGNQRTITHNTTTPRFLSHFSPRMTKVLKAFPHQKVILCCDGTKIVYLLTVLFLAHGLHQLPPISMRDGSKIVITSLCSQLRLRLLFGYISFLPILISVPDHTHPFVLILG